MKTLRIFLLVLIIIGVGLIVSESFWVPSVVDRILQYQGNGADVSPIMSDTSKQTVTSKASVVISKPKTQTISDTFAATPSEGQEPLTVSFNVSMNKGVYRVDFGDGTTSQRFESPSSLTHIYEKPGLYTAVLEYFYNDPTYDLIKSQTIAVGGTGKTPTLSSVSPNEGPIGTQITITGSGFIAPGNFLLLDGKYRALSDVSLGSDSLITLTFPQRMVDKDACTNLPPQTTCEFAVLDINPGQHTIALQNANGISNVLTFTVTAN
jgi:hypothetical protein